MDATKKKQKIDYYYLKALELIASPYIKTKFHLRPGWSLGFEIDIDSDGGRWSISTCAYHDDETVDAIDCEIIDAYKQLRPNIAYMIDCVTRW